MEIVPMELLNPDFVNTCHKNKVVVFNQNINRFLNLGILPITLGIVFDKHQWMWMNLFVYMS